MSSGLNCGPAALLRLGGRSERVLEPLVNNGMELKRLHPAYSLHSFANCAV